jgi:hypothetical protein
VLRANRTRRSRRMTRCRGRLTLCGWQVADNPVERHASVTATDVQLDAAALRQLAAMVGAPQNPYFTE